MYNVNDIAATSIIRQARALMAERDISRRTEARLARHLSLAVVLHVPRSYIGRTWSRLANVNHADQTSATVVSVRPTLAGELSGRIGATGVIDARRSADRGSELHARLRFSRRNSSPTVQLQQKFPNNFLSLSLLTRIMFDVSRKN